jgi:serine/threonine-protein kinase HipA
MSNRQCLYCYQPLGDEDQYDFHPACSKIFFGTEIPPRLEFTFQQMSELAKQVVERSVTVPGVQPKISLSIVSKVIDKDKANRLTIVGALEGNFILKPPTVNFPQLPENESVTMRIAESFGIRVVPSSLIRLKSGELAYITKRIDRKEDGEKIHMLDMFQITEAFDKYKSSMERVGKAVNAYSSNTFYDLVNLFELSIFSFLTGNNDMHLKNFSLINENNWMLSPAYDLLNVVIANPEDKEELALTLEGKKKKLKKEYFIRWAEQMGLNRKQIEGVFAKFNDKKEEAINWVKNSFLSDSMQQDYIEVLEERFSRLSIDSI